MRRHTWKVKNFTTGTSSCCGGKPEVNIPNVHGLLVGIGWYSDVDDDINEEVVVLVVSSPSFAALSRSNGARR